MTLEEFNNITTWQDLRDCCDDNDCPEFFYDNDIETDEELDDIINDWLSDCGLPWYELRDTLSDIPQGYDYYKYYGVGDIVGLYDGDAYFDDLKAEIKSYFEERELFDDVEDEPEDEFFEDAFEEIEPEDDFDYEEVTQISEDDFGNFFIESSGIFAVYKKKESDKEEEALRKLREIEVNFEELGKAVLL